MKEIGALISPTTFRTMAAEAGPEGQQNAPPPPVAPLGAAALAPEPATAVTKEASEPATVTKEALPAADELDDSLGADTGDEDLVSVVLDIMGLKGEVVGENDTLMNLGVDSMQSIEVIAAVHQALGRPFSFMEIGTLSPAKLRAMAAEAGQERQQSAPAPPKTQFGAAAAASAPEPVTVTSLEAADEPDALPGAVIRDDVITQGKLSASSIITSTEE